MAIFHADQADNVLTTGLGTSCLCIKILHSCRPFFPSVSGSKSWNVLSLSFADMLRDASGDFLVSSFPRKHVARLMYYKSFHGTSTYYRCLLNGRSFLEEVRRHFGPYCFRPPAGADRSKLGLLENRTTSKLTWRKLTRPAGIGRFFLCKGLLDGKWRHPFLKHSQMSKRRSSGRTPMTSYGLIQRPAFRSVVRELGSNQQSQHNNPSDILNLDGGKLPVQQIGSDLNLCN